MAKYIFLLSIYWLCSLTLCKGQGQDFLDTVELKTIPSLSNVYWQTSNIAFSEGWLFVEDQLTEQRIQVYDPETGEKVYEFGRRGRGPGEYQSFSIQRGPDSGIIEISDVNNKKNDIYDVGCLKQKPPVSETYKCILKSVSILAARQALIFNNNNIILNHGATINGNLFLSRGEQIVNHLAEIPQPVAKKYTQPIHATLATSGRIAANPDRTRFAYFAESFDWALFFIRKEDEMKLLKEYDFSFLPEFTIHASGGSSGILTPAEDHRTAFKYPVSGKDHYFVLYSGKTAEDAEREQVLGSNFTNRLKVFDWEGNEVKEIILSQNITIFTVNHEETKLYGITFNKDFEATVFVGSLNQF